MFTGHYGVSRFSLQYLWKRAVRITQKPYTPQRERLCMVWGNPVIFTDCRKILQLSQGFPPICKYYRVSPQHTQSFPLSSIGFLCDSNSPFSIDIAGKTYGHPVNPCKHLQCTLLFYYTQNSFKRKGIFFSGNLYYDLNICMAV